MKNIGKLGEIFLYFLCLILVLIYIKKLYIAPIGGAPIESNNGNNYVLRLPPHILSNIHHYKKAILVLANLVHVHISDIIGPTEQHPLHKNTEVDDSCMDGRLPDYGSENRNPRVRLPASSLLIGVTTKDRGKMINNVSDYKAVWDLIDDVHGELAHNTNTIGKIRLHLHIGEKACGGANLIEQIYLRHMPNYKDWSAVDRLMYHVYGMLTKLDDLGLIGKNTSLGLEFPKDGVYRLPSQDLNVHIADFESTFKNLILSNAFQYPKSLFHASQPLCAEGVKSPPRRLPLSFKKNK